MSLVSRRDNTNMPLVHIANGVAIGECAESRPV